MDNGLCEPAAPKKKFPAKFITELQKMVGTKVFFEKIKIELTSRGPGNELLFTPTYWSADGAPDSKD